MVCKNARESLGLTQPELGDLVGKNKSQIYKFESGRLSIPGSHLAFCKIVWRLSLEKDFEGSIKPIILSKLDQVPAPERGYYSAELVAITVCIAEGKFKILEEVIGVSVDPSKIPSQKGGTSMQAVLSSIESLVNNTLREHAKSQSGEVRRGWEDVLLQGAQFVQKMRIALDREEGQEEQQEPPDKS